MRITPVVPKRQICCDGFAGITVCLVRIDPPGQGGGRGSPPVADGGPVQAPVPDHRPPLVLVTIPPVTKWPPQGPLALRGPLASNRKPMIVKDHRRYRGQQSIYTFAAPGHVGHRRCT